MMTEHNRYHIKIKGHLQPCWQDWFDGLTIIQVDDGNTLLTGSVADQAALFGLLRKVRDLGMALLSIQCDETSLQTNIAPISQDTNQVLSNKEKEK